MNIENKVAVVTGGASGLGRATSSALLKRGIKVVILDLNAEQGQTLMDEFGSDRACFITTDVTDEASVQNAFEKALEQFKRVDICINCAGIAPAKKVLNKESKAQALSAFSLAIQINLIGSFNVAKVAAEKMALNTPDNNGERGVIINTASVAAYDGQMGQTAYAASKGGIVAMTLPMARDLASTGIRVNTIAPGIMGTPMLLAMPEKVQNALVENIQFPKRMGRPEEFANLSVHIVENAYINGETIRLDGGIRMPAR